MLLSFQSPIDITTDGITYADGVEAQRAPATFLESAFLLELEMLGPRTFQPQRHLVRDTKAKVLKFGSCVNAVLGHKLRSLELCFLALAFWSCNPQTPCILTFGWSRAGQKGAIPRTARTSFSLASKHNPHCWLFSYIAFASPRHSPCLATFIAP